MYESRTTQESQILDLLTERKGSGVFAFELAEPKPRGCGILQYNARIYGLRKKGHNIVSDTKGHFILQERQEEQSEVNEKLEYKMTQIELDEKLAKLREEWKTAGPGMRKLIETRANLLKKRFNEENNIKPTQNLDTAYEKWQALKEQNVI
jgi:hypothetical protein